jgi:hypothetical protein
VLQASQNTNINDLPQADREKLPAQKAMAAAMTPGNNSVPSTNITGAKK